MVPESSFLNIFLMQNLFQKMYPRIEILFQKNLFQNVFDVFQNLYFEIFIPKNVSKIILRKSCFENFKKLKFSKYIIRKSFLRKVKCHFKNLSDARKNCRSAERNKSLIHMNIFEIYF